MTAATKTRLDDMGKRVHELLKTLPDHDAITDTLDYLLGALYGLTRAANLGFVERAGPFDPTYRPFLAQYVLVIVADRPVNELWLAGFYFNSAIQRLAASYDRIPKLLKIPKRKKDSAHDLMATANKSAYHDWSKVYREVNSFKHDPEGKAKGRHVTMDIALSATSQAIDLLERSIAPLSRKYPQPKR